MSVSKLQAASQPAANCWISLGSNHHSQQELQRAISLLGQHFGQLQLSATYITQPVGIKAKKCAPFYNLVAGFVTALSVGEIQKILKTIEAKTTYLMPEDLSLYVRALDLDLISLNDLHGCIEGIQLPYKDLLKHDFVLRPLAEINPEGVPPGFDLNYAQLWQKYAHPEQKMQPANLVWA